MPAVFNQMLYVTFYCLGYWMFYILITPLSFALGRSDVTWKQPGRCEDPFAGTGSALRLGLSLRHS